MKKNTKKMVIDRTILNLKVSSLANKSYIDSEVHTLYRVMNKISEIEMTENRPIMDITMEITEVKEIFKDDLEKLKYFKLV